MPSPITRRGDSNREDVPKCARLLTWEIEVDDVCDVVDVNSSRCDVRGDEDPNLASLEVKQGLLTVRLLAVTMDALTVNACNHETSSTSNTLVFWWMEVDM